MTTPNLGLIKPKMTDTPSKTIPDLATNMELIDEGVVALLNGHEQDEFAHIEVVSSGVVRVGWGSGAKYFISFTLPAGEWVPIIEVATSGNAFFRLTIGHSDLTHLQYAGVITRGYGVAVLHDITGGDSGSSLRINSTDYNLPTIEVYGPNTSHSYGRNLRCWVNC